MAIQPINPAVFTAGIRPVDLGQKLQTGIQTGAMIGNISQKRQEQAQAAQMNEQYKADLKNAIENPTQGNWAEMIAKYPQQREAFGDVAKMYSQEQIENEFWQGAAVSTALENNNPEVAKQELMDLIQANENAGEPTGGYRQILNAIDTGNIQGAQAMTNMALSIMSPDKFKSMVESRTAIPKAAAELTEKQAMAQKAAVAANFAESQAAIDLQKKGWDIYKIQEDTKIARENSKIAMMNAKLAKEKNELKQEELRSKLEDAKRKRDESVREKAADIETANLNIDNMLNTADRILATPIGVVESATGPISTRFPTLSEDTADFEALIENIDAQAFLAQIPNMKGLGALSDAEGKKIASALQNLSLRQSPQRLLNNVREVQRLLLKARTNVARRYGVPETTPDTPAAAESTSPEELDALIQKYAGGQ